MSSPTTFVRLLLAGILLSAALALWNASTIADDLARRHELIATFVDPDEGESRNARWWTTMLRRTLDPAVVQDAPTRDYWQGRYHAGENTPGSSGERDDTASQLIAANAAFRRTQRDAANRSLSVDELDRALQAYAAVLKNGGFDRDAAWNYEFIARLRDHLAREKPAGRSAGAKPASPGGAVDPARPARTDRSGLPSGPTIHGRPGTHPPSTKGEEFEVITPMDYGDREAQPEPTPGVKLPRKG